ncbi:MAG: AAA domain-containing protein, partial [Mariniphaga sp.]
MQLDDKILIVLQESSGLKSKDIALKIFQKFNETIDKDEINKILYYKLIGKVFQDSKYQWSLGQEGILKKTNPFSSTDTPLSKLSTYYLKCLSTDIESGIWCYAASKFGSLDYGQLNFLPQFCDNNSSDLFKSEDVKKIINKVRLDRNRLVLQLGYPINLRRVLARSGNSAFYVVEPILLIAFDTQSFVNGNIPTLINEMPRFNFEAIKNISGLDKNELFDEIIALSDELGLNNPPADQPSLDEIVIRMCQLRPQWNWQDTIMPGVLTTQLLKNGTQEGILNSAAVFFSEHSKYTQGLEKELDILKQFETKKISRNALDQWITGKFSPFEYKDIVLIEPLQLNDEQRNAVKRSLQAPLTVVTGPPGTGKSQVVTSIVINAIYQGQTVLFASKNNKAVEVVNERVNGLTSRPVMLRLGNSNLQSELARYLTGLLASTTTKLDDDNYEISKSRHESLVKKIDVITTAQKELLIVRNTTDKLEQNIEGYRELFGDLLFYNFKDFENRRFQEIERTIKIFVAALSKADKNKQPIFTRLFWSFFRKARLESVSSQLPSIKIVLSELKIEPPQIHLDENSLQIYYSTMHQLETQLKYAKDVSSYFKSLELLNKQKSLFQLALESIIIENSISENSHDLWKNWLRLLPKKLGGENRKDLGDYATLLNLIANANKDNKPLDKKIWGRFYSLQAKVTNIL